MNLTGAERKWVRLKWEHIRKAQIAADNANNEWSKLNDEINDYMDRSGITGVLTRTKVKGESIPLKDALATGTWHSRNAERHIHDLQLFLKLKELDLL